MVYMYHSFLVHSSADGHRGCFHVLAMTNSAAMNIGVHVSLSDLVSSVCMPRSGIAGSYGSSISSFLRLINLFILAAPGLSCCAQASSNCGEQGCSLVECSDFCGVSCFGAGALRHTGFSSCGSWVA